MHNYLEESDRIRKVLQRLALEHLVSIKPKRDAFVAEPDNQEAHDVFGRGN